MKLTDPVIGGGPKVQPEYVAFDSFGVMGQCTLVTTPDVVVCIDPGASAESASFPLPEPERRALEARYLDACRAAAAKAKAIVVSHYHLDHFLDARDPGVYAGKVLFAKALDDLPPKQLARAERFHATIAGLPDETVWCDGRRFKFGRTEVAFSEPAWHGEENAEPGTVVMVEVKRGREELLFTSDVCGPTFTGTAEFVANSGARTVILDGYPTILLGQLETDLDLVRSVINVCRILHSKGLKTLVFDHHHCRDYRYPAFYRLAYDKARQLKKEFGSAAELAGNASAVLRGLQDHGPTKWKKWAPLDLNACRTAVERAAPDPKTKKSLLRDLDRWVA
ncbi:MBL fold metallo-hydrolase [candidate division WOR-3 bacterium]|nr:MBL fold metallo-hydrolase [candidate division WOR-3 bacterium]